MAPPEREFYRRIDGAADLAALFAGFNAEDRSRRMDWLVLQLRKGALALLPVPVEELERSSDPSQEDRQRWWRRLLPQRS